MVESPVAREFEVRVAEKADTETLVKLTLEFLREQRVPPDRARVRRAYEEIALHPRECPAFLLLDEERPVGYALACLRPCTQLGRVLRVHDLYVDPSVRNLGAGHRLVDHLVAQARKSGIARVELEMSDANVDARRLFGRLGFRPAGRSIVSREA